VCHQNTILELEEKMEICSLEGTLTPERSHLHIVLGREDGAAIAGHLMGREGSIYGCNIPSGPTPRHDVID
jgi:predicted DNA-binding protein with PD1-like motif